MNIEKPYWVCTSDDYPFPGHDFNRDIVEPGDIEEFPEGAVGVRVDGDFWLVAILPLEKYRDVSIEDIVVEFWPDIENPRFCPDSTDMEDMAGV